MITKNKCQEIVDKESPWIIKALGLKSRPIKIYVVSSDDKKGPIPYNSNVFAVCYNDINKSTIGIFHDKQCSPKEAFLSLVHELLHVKFYVLRKYIKKNKMKGYFNAEERVVHKIEGLISMCLSRKLFK